MKIFNHFLNKIVSSKSNICGSISSFNYKSGLLIIIGKILILFIAGSLFAQTDSDLSESDNITENKKIEESNLFQDNNAGNDSTGSSEVIKTENIQNNKIDKNKDQRVADSSEKGQIQTDTENKVPVITKENKNKTKDNSKSVNSQDEPARKEKSSIDKAGLISGKPAVKINGLLDIKDGNFKYSRIPGISFPKKEPAEAKESEDIQEKIFADEPEEQLVTKEKEAEKSIIGMEKGAADTFVKILLVCLIIGIIILFKFRSKNRNSKVVRRFPGA